MARKKPTTTDAALDTPDALQDAVEVEELDEDFGLARRGVRVEVAKDEDGKYYWVLWSSNGVPIATGPKGYQQLSHLKDAVTAIRTALNSDDLRYVRLY